ncbi:MAG TPA: PadR family transcriptional regulator [Candidatus Acidoferrales bacterium]|nr:PadR family transcriptional regulator [Candidatus Acidoferrales bacterium]
MAAAKNSPKTSHLSTPDLVLLSLLAEKPMHGYQANAELERRQIRDWAAISRPQVYYSMEKLARAGLIRRCETADPSEGPERQVFCTTKRGIDALADSLERGDWVTARERPPFLTWMALSWKARPGVLARQIQRRQEFLERELARERATLEAVRVEVGHDFHEAVWMITLMIEQFETEMRWLERLKQQAEKRGAARHPRLVSH